MRCVAALCLSLFLSIASAQDGPAGYFAPVSDSVETPNANAAPPPADAGPVEKARHYFAEKSWKLAANIFDDPTTASLSADQQRELTYITAEALSNLHQEDKSRALLEKLITGDAKDVWAGHAHKLLQPGLSPRSWLDRNTTNPLAHLRAAEQIFADLQSDELNKLYQAVIDSSLIVISFPSEDDNQYVMSTFDKLTPHLSDAEALAKVQLRRQDALSAHNRGRTSEERIAGWRGIVSEFPGTRAAADAQSRIARHYVQTRDYIAALQELDILIDKFPGTREAEQAAKEIELIKRPEAAYALPQQFLPGEAVTFDLAARNTAQVAFSVIPVDVIAQMKEQKTDNLDLEKVTGTPVLTKDVAVGTRDDHQSTTRTVELDLNKPGSYVLRAEIDGKVVCNRLLLISDLVLVGNMSSNAYEFWTVDAVTGKPRPNTRITVASNIQRDQQWTSGQSRSYFSSFDNIESDSSGFADFAPTGNRDPRMFAAAKNGDHIAYFGEVYWSNQGRTNESRPMAYVYTDRPVYRPEQTVYWRAIVRDSSDGEYALPKDRKYTIRISDTRNEEVLKKSGLELSEFGTLDGELSLMAGAPLGQYSITIFEEGSQRRHVGNGQFRVEEYKKPEFEVSVAPASDFARVGESVEAKVEARYLFGAPVTDGTVRYTVRRSPRFSILWDYLRWDIDRDLGWFEEEPQRPPVLHGSSGTIIADGEGKLNPDGTFTVTFDAVVPDEELKNAQVPMPGRGFSSYIWPPRNPSTWDFQVEVTVTDASRRNIDASSVVPVGLKALNLATKTNRNLVTPGDNARVELKSMNLADKPVAISGTLYVEKLVWNETAKKDDITTVSTQAASIDSDGSLIVDWRVPDDVKGRLRFAFVAADPFGGESVAYANFYSASSDDTDVYARYQGVEIITDKTQYTVGETARVMILSEFKDAVAWYWIDAGSGNLHKQVLPLPHRTNFVSIPITEAFVPNSMVHIVSVRDRRYITDEVELIVPPTSRVVDVTITPDRDTVEPGDTGTVTIHATDAEGKPVSGEFSLSVFDQAITYIAPDSRPDIRRIFYGMKRHLQSNVQTSLNYTRNIGGPTFENAFRFLTFTEAAPASDLESQAVASRSAPPPAFASPARAGMASVNFFDFAKNEFVSGFGKSPADNNLSMFESPQQDVMPEVRTDFRDSMFWSPTVRTDESGRATVKVTYPDSLTTWRMVAVGVTPDTRVGNATTETIARKKVLVRLQAPRFFRERDEVTVSGNVHNYTDADLTLDTTLRAAGVRLDGGTTMPLDGKPDFLGSTSQVTIPAGGEQRVDWTVHVDSAAAGEAVLNLAALSPGGSDAMEIRVPLLPHGIDKFVAWNGSSRDADSSDTKVTADAGGKTITRTITLPAERIRETSRLDIIVNPSLASSIRDAIPYMIDYPYGCLEQTLSRFVPATVAARAFHVLGYPLDTHLQERLDKVTSSGLARVRDMQLPSGGWGWWANDAENLNMTAYAMYALTLARDAEVAVDAGVYDRGLSRLATLRDDITSKTAAATDTGYWYPFNLHNLMFAEYVLTLNNQSSPRAVEVLWDRRDELRAHGLSMLARTLAKLGRNAEAELVLRNMVNMAVHQPENDTLRWGRVEQGWRWYEEPVEATAVGLMAYLELKPDDPAVEQAVKWLVLNRQGKQWKSTRDTAQSVLALTQYMLVKQEAAKPVTIEVSVGDKPVRTLDVNPANFWDFDGHITLRGDEIPDGEFPVSFKVSGEGSIYYSIFAEYFTQEEGITSAGNEIYVERIYERLEMKRTTETVAGAESPVTEETWVPLREGDAINSGDELRVTLKIKSLNDYEYLVFEDPKPAGTEPVDLQSGSRYADGLCSNMELRDAWVAFFMTRLPQGEHTITYRVRAEIPGVFHAMPTTGYAMYFPPLRANANEAIMKISDK